MKGRIPLTVGLAIGLALLVLAGLSGQTGRALAGCDRYVLGSDGVDTGDCSDEAHPCDTIQYAIDQADPGDVICVAYTTSAGPRTYPETLTIHESITLEGGWQASCTGPDCSYSSIPCDPANVIIDAGGAGRVISISGSIAPTIDCFTIRGGDANNLGGSPGGSNVGGGIYSRDAAPIIVNNVISDNIGCDSCSTALGHGGGIYLLNAPATAVISNNLIAYNLGNNAAWGQGGGVMLQDSDAQIISNTIAYNRAGYSSGEGGGIRVRDGNPTIVGNTIEWNDAGWSMFGRGGGISVLSGDSITIERNLFNSNDAIENAGFTSTVSTGGGIHVHGNPTVAAIIRDNRLEYNWASPEATHAGHGGGMYLQDLRMPSDVSGNNLVFNIAGLYHNGKGGGIYLEDCEAHVTDNTFTDNTATFYGDRGEGGALYISGGVMFVQNNEMSQNYAVRAQGAPYTGSGYGGAVAATGGMALILYNDITSNYGTRAEGSGYGGGVYVSGGTMYGIAGNTFKTNIATAHEEGYGGGVAISGTNAFLYENTIAYNGACVDTPWTTGGTNGAGGGIYAVQSTALLLGNYIHHNVAAQVNIGLGGGVYVDSSTTLLDRNTILDNLASLGSISRGGGIRLTVNAVFSVTNNIIARNMAYENASGIGVASYSSGAIAHNTIAENLYGDGVGIHVASVSHVTLTNNIIVTQTVGIQNAGHPGSTVSATHTLFEANGTDYGAGVTSSSEIAGPALLRSDYRLRPGSNAIDQGLPMVGVTHDIDLDPRPVGIASDVGADEYALKAYLPIALRNH